jgi:hypothetical protein
MVRPALPTTLIFCCPLPSSLSTDQLTACLEAAAHPAPSITWVTTAERLPLLRVPRGPASTAPLAAVDVPAAALESRQSLRRLLACAQSAASGIDTALVRGPLPHDCRRMLVDAGIAVVLRDFFDPMSRGPRRPAPNGWPCRSMLWGLWEVTAADAGPPGMIGRLVPWMAADRLRPGGLAVVDLAGAMPTAASIRDRLDRWQAWVRRQRAGAVEIATLASLPELITGAARRPLSGSVLKAA